MFFHILHMFAQHNPHNTKKFSSKFSVKLLRTLVQRIVHPSCAAQPTQHKKIPLKFSTQTATTMYRSPEFAFEFDQSAAKGIKNNQSNKKHLLFKIDSKE